MTLTYPRDIFGQRTGIWDDHSSVGWVGWDVYWSEVAGQHISMGGADSWLAHSDAIDSTNLVTDQTGAVVYETEFGPWGRTLKSGGPRPWGVFAGLRWPVNDPLQPSATREYSSSLGRWMTPDPGGVKVVKLDNPQTWNMYAYVGNNPTSRNDPSGLYAAPSFNCDENHSACLNDEQRRLLNNSTMKDQGGNKVSGEELYNSLTEKQKNAFVNVTDHLRSIRFSNGTTALSAVNSVTSFENDRIKATVSAGFEARIAADTRFKKVSGALHDGYSSISFKSREAQGNIQFSFNKSYSAADIDNDLHQGFWHTFEVLNNAVTGDKTDQDAVRRILLENPNILTTPSPDPLFNR